LSIDEDVDASMTSNRPSCTCAPPALPCCDPSVTVTESLKNLMIRLVVIPLRHLGCWIDAVLLLANKAVGVGGEPPTA
jgi:hypothetical protein